jgi:hypothetical protein
MKSLSSKLLVRISQTFEDQKYLSVRFHTTTKKIPFEDFRRKGITIAKDPYCLHGSNFLISIIKDPNLIWLELIQER